MTTIAQPSTQPVLSARARRPDAARGFGPRAVLGEDGIPLAGGAPSPDLLPREEIARASAELTGDPAALAAALPYGAAAGSPRLRELIAASEGVDPERVLVTNGAFHGLSLVFDALLDPGSPVVVEEPTYPLVFRSLLTKDPQLVHLPLTADGLDIDVLEDRLRAGVRPRLLYTIPDHHNPTGLVVPPEQRQRLLELAEHYGFVIVSDNAYRRLAFDGAEPPDYPADSEYVVQVRTFSKLLGPGLRIGWLVLPPWLAGPVQRLRANQDQHTSGLTQAIVERVIEPEGSLQQIADRARRAYAERFDLATGILDDALPGGIEVPFRTGGIFLWAKVRDPGIDLATAQQVARTRYGTDAVLGRYFFREDPQEDRGFLRIGISHLPVERLGEGVRRLAAALNDPEARR